MASTWVDGTGVAFGIGKVSCAAATREARGRRWKRKPIQGKTYVSPRDAWTRRKPIQGEDLNSVTKLPYAPILLIADDEPAIRTGLPCRSNAVKMALCGLIVARATMNRSCTRSFSCDASFPLLWAFSV